MLAGPVKAYFCNHLKDKEKLSVLYQGYCVVLNVDYQDVHGAPKITDVSGKLSGRGFLHLTSNAGELMTKNCTSKLRYFLGQTEAMIMSSFKQNIGMNFPVYKRGWTMLIRSALSRMEEPRNTMKPLSASRLALGIGMSN